jgi:hypothetical protein
MGLQCTSEDVLGPLFGYGCHLLQLYESSGLLILNDLSFFPGSDLFTYRLHCGGASVVDYVISSHSFISSIRSLTISHLPMGGKIVLMPFAGSKSSLDPFGGSLSGFKGHVMKKVVVSEPFLVSRSNAMTLDAKMVEDIDHTSSICSSSLGFSYDSKPWFILAITMNTGDNSSQNQTITYQCLCDCVLKLENDNILLKERVSKLTAEIANLN